MGDFKLLLFGVFVALWAQTCALQDIADKLQRVRNAIELAGQK